MKRIAHKKITSGSRVSSTISRGRTGGTPHATTRDMVHDTLHDELRAPRDTVFTLPRTASITAIAEACRQAALAFVNEVGSGAWDEELVTEWLLETYAPLVTHEADAEPSGGDPLGLSETLRGLEPRLIRATHEEILDVLRSTRTETGGANFAFMALSSGFVAPCEERGGRRGWLPASKRRFRLADRVLSLFAVDYLIRAEEYESMLTLCDRCAHVTFDAIDRAYMRCARHASGITLRGEPATIPHLPRETA